MKAAAILLVLVACEDSLDQRLAIIREPRVLAVITEPAEARPGTPVDYAIVAATPDGPLAAEPTWSYCDASKPPTEDNAVSEDCLGPEHLIELGTGPAITATLPTGGCILFGPGTPGSGFRPRDPDPTGGYYQPIRADADALVAFGLTRITCQLPTAPPEVARRYDLEYVANQNPTLLPVALTEVPADSDVTLVASWPETSAESYLYYDALSQTLVTRREAMRVSWFATGGELAVDATAVGESDFATEASTTWHTPAAGPATLWLVLRDSRGGIATQTLELVVR
ncbi:MAG TPA: hypothetical protein VIU61_21350 [Kofleriaceae bacterium]